MKKVFVDTAAWIALINSDDDFHGSALLIMRQLQQQKCRLVTTDFILLELADALVSSKLRPKTIAFINRLKGLQDLQIIPYKTRLQGFSKIAGAWVNWSFSRMGH